MASKKRIQLVTEYCVQSKAPFGPPREVAGAVCFRDPKRAREYARRERRRGVDMVIITKRRRTTARRRKSYRVMSIKDATTLTKSELRTQIANDVMRDNPKMWSNMREALEYVSAQYPTKGDLLSTGVSRGLWYGDLDRRRRRR